MKTTKHNLRFGRLGRLALVGLVALGAIPLATGGTAQAATVSSAIAIQPPGTVQTTTGQTFRASSDAYSGVINTSGSGFASGGNVRIDAYNPATGHTFYGWVNATKDSWAYNSSTGAWTFVRGGKFSVDISVPWSEMKVSCGTDCFGSATLSVHAYQYSSPQVVTPWVSVKVSEFIVG